MRRPLNLLIVRSQPWGLASCKSYIHFYRRSWRTPWGIWLACALSARCLSAAPRLYLHPACSGGSRALRAASPALRASSPYRLAAFRWYALVVGPSPTFRPRGSAAGCPIPSFFKPSRLPFPASLWYGGLSGFPSNSPGGAPGSCPPGRLWSLP